MYKKRDLLIEIGLEELPHEFICNAINELKTKITESLKEERIEYSNIRHFSTPRRLGLLINEVSIVQNDCDEERRGPSFAKAFYEDGKPTKALLGFVKTNHVNIKDTVVKEVNNGKYVFLVRKLKGKNTVEILPEILKHCLTSFNFLKSMKWEKSSFMFARPIRWLLFIFGKDIIPFRIADIESSNVTYGHRTYFHNKIILKNPADYEEKLLNASVIVDRDKRRYLIENQIKDIINEKPLEVPEEAMALYDVNTDLTEYPVPVLCEFNKHFLELPPEVLTSEMIENQKYFPLLWKANKKLSNYFIVVSNIKDNSKTKSGYERVLRARLDDGKFFYEEDKKATLLTRLNDLKKVLFHEKLGSMYERVGRIKEISLRLSDLLSLDEKTRSNIEETALLCKNDLTTLMIHEFPGLQGIMGYYYAIASGYSEDIAIGIKEHYYPRYANDRLPSRIEGTVVGIADRLDIIISMFSIGLKPKGSKDPFGLRRKVLAIIRIIIAQKLNFSMRALVENVASLYSIKNKIDLIAEIEDFFKNRIKTIFADMGFSYDEIEASLTNVLNDIYEGYKRVEALHKIRGKENFNDLLISFKRMSNIVKNEKNYEFSEKRLKENEEIELYEYFSSVKEKILENIKLKDYKEVYKILSTFKPYVDNFFDNVLVIDENLSLRGNRISLLRYIINVFSDIIDFSKIVLPQE